MSWDNKKDDWNLSVRTGPSIGKASENRMLDAMGGNDTIKKRLQTNADGSVTMAHTRGPGTQPEFITTGIVTGDPCYDVYLESGAIDLVNTSSLYGASAVPVWYAGVAALSAKWVGSVSRKKGKLGLLTNSPPVGSSQLSKAAPVGSLTKRQVMQAVPASLYTGKMRLFIQSLYGAKNSTNFPLDVVESPGLAPYLSYRIPRGSEYELVYLNGNTGIYTDSEYRFWLVGVNSTDIRISLLACDTCTERFRPLLKTATTDLERDQISAYILSQSQPVGSFFSIPLSVPTLNQFGYGWHFNWDGSKADIVKVDTVPNGGGVKYVSTHFRITIRRDETVAMVFPDDSEHWSASIETVETGEWKNITHVDVISHPDWLENKQFIFNGHGSRFGDNFGVAAPFYCFYNRDELKVCRYSHTTQAGSTFEESHPQEYSETWLYAVYCDFGVHTYSYGTRGDRSTRQIDVGPESVSAVNQTETAHFDELELKWDGVTNGEAASYTVPQNSASSYTYTPNSYPRTPVTVNYVSSPAPATYGYSTQCNASLRHDFFDQTKTIQGAVICVIPFFDAEAAYLVDVDINHNVRTTRSQGYGTSTQFSASMGVQALYVNHAVVALSYGGTIRSNALVSFGNYETTGLPDTDSTITTVQGSLVCGSGVLTIDESAINVSAMQQPTDYYSYSLFPEKSSAGESYTYGFAVDMPSGLVPEGGIPSFIGWA